ncbi:MAG: hypothetical protein IT215_05510 [Chitinophagaceae bacterium]|nr:hypothetical protein [Chitinophagaceae bacterium]
MRRIIEAGHYYKVIGPTEYSRLGTQLLKKILRKEEKNFEELTGKGSYKEDTSGLVYDSWHDQGELSKIEFNNLLELEKDIVSSTMLFIDDFHGYECIPIEEKNAPKWETVNDSFLCFDHFLLESTLLERAETVLSMLKSEVGNKVKCSKRDEVFCSGIKLMKEGRVPTCVLLDVALTLYKQELGFNKGLNILPYFYESEQLILKKIISKIMPNFELKNVFFAFE